VSRVFVDSSVWIDHLRGVDSLAEPDEIVVLVEVLRGIDDDRQRRRVRETLLAFETVRIGRTATALLAVEHHVALRRLGRTVRKAIDCLIAAWCIEHGVPLLHADRDFLPFARHRGLLQA
jgi:predicted nucleic acid-binding protein